jgi:hypothetical protein
MHAFKRPFNRIAVATFLLLTMLAWRADAIAAQLTVTWVANSIDEVGFSLERSTGTSEAFTEIAMTGPGITTDVDSSVTDGTTYCYRARAFDSTSYSDYSNTACGVTAQAFSLAVVKTGAGSGAVISAPSGIICGSSCSGTFPGGTAVTLTATPATGSTFTGWNGGGCTGTGPCVVTLTASTTVTPTFDPQALTLTASKTGTGIGTVASTPAGIDCGTSCSASYPGGTAVTLTAAPAADSTFTGWSGGCTGTGACTVSLTTSTTVSATFVRQSFALTVGKTGAGSGTVTSTPAGINCGTTCSASYPGGTAVTLTAKADRASSIFAGWSGGGCTATASCTVSVTAATTITATFDPRSKGGGNKH